VLTSLAAELETIVPSRAELYTVITISRCSTSTEHKFLCSSALHLALFLISSPEIMDVRFTQAASAIWRPECDEVVQSVECQPLLASRTAGKEYEVLRVEGQMTSQTWPTKYWINWATKDGKRYPNSWVLASECDCPDLIDDFRELMIRDFGGRYQELMRLPKKKLPAELVGLWKLWYCQGPYMQFFNSAYPSRTYIQIKRLRYLQPPEGFTNPPGIPSLPQWSNFNSLASPFIKTTSSASLRQITSPSLIPITPVSIPLLDTKLEALDQHCTCVLVGEQLIFHCNNCATLRRSTTSFSPKDSFLVTGSDKNQARNIWKSRKSTPATYSPFGTEVVQSQSKWKNDRDSIETLLRPSSCTSNSFIDRHSIPIRKIGDPYSGLANWFENWFEASSDRSFTQLVHGLISTPPDIQLESQTRLYNAISSRTSGLLFQNSKPKLENNHVVSLAPQTRNDGNLLEKSSPPSQERSFMCRLENMESHIHQSPNHQRSFRHMRSSNPKTDRKLPFKRANGTIVHPANVRCARKTQREGTVRRNAGINAAHKSIIFSGVKTVF